MVSARDNLLRNGIQFIKEILVADFVSARKRVAVADLLSKDDLIKESNLEIESFSLDVSQPKENVTLTDYENVKRVYTHMKFLSDSFSESLAVIGYDNIGKFEQLYQMFAPDIVVFETADYAMNESLFSDSVLRNTL